MGINIGMVVPHITTFCWCMGLEMGSKLIGFVHLLISLSLMVVCSVFAENARGFRGTLEDADGVYSAWYVIAVVVAVVSLVHVLLALTLLFSVYNRHTGGLRAWACVMGVLVCVALAGVAASAALAGLSASGSDIFLSFLEGLLFFGMIIYCILCVNSYYLMLKSCEDMEGPNKTEYHVSGRGREN